MEGEWFNIPAEQMADLPREAAELPEGYSSAIDLSEQLQVRMDTEEKEYLQKLADVLGLSMSDVIRNAIKLYSIVKEIRLGEDE